MNTETKDEVVYLYLDDIIPNRFQPREIFDEKALKELAVSIKEHGVIQPIIVRSVNGKYEIIAGERRYKASALAGMTKIPAIIRNLDDKESSKVALLENLQRKNLNPIEEARTYQKILEIDQMTQDELAKTMGKSQSAIANKLRLLALPDEIQDALLKEQISERHARTLLNISDPTEQKNMLKKVISNKMTVRALEEEISKMNPPKAEPSEPMTIPEVSPDGILSRNNLINEVPITPTSVDLPTSESEKYGEVKIVPPMNDQSENKFINYGEIDKEEVEEPKDTYFNKVEVQPVNVSTIKENAMDIKAKTSEPAADLDSLLNIQNVRPAQGSSFVTKAKDQYLTPAEAIVKGEQHEEEQKDYFKIPNMGATGVSLDSNPAASAPVSILNIPAPVQEKTTYTIDDVTNKIREVVKDLESHGVKVTFDEMNFDTAYQVIIKVDK
ncbi:MAG: ParB/RepB/Spo0J family partition protein [Tenericutes bacterium]|nr:ParB/RepB/Spo0J family partition protein [Mycoplasmatota bacterium]